MAQLDRLERAASLLIVSQTYRIVGDGEGSAVEAFDSELFSRQALEASADSHEESSHDTLFESRLMDLVSQFKLDWDS